MSKKLIEMGYNPEQVACARFFDLDNVMTLKEQAEFYGGDYDEKWEADDKHLIDTFKRDGFEFIGCVVAKEELRDDDNCAVEGGYLVKGCYLDDEIKLYVVADVWDEARGQAPEPAYRYCIFDEGSFDYEVMQKAYEAAFGTNK